MRQAEHRKKTHSCEFQSTHLREVRQAEHRKKTHSCEFQSTHLREVRLKSIRLISSRPIFQSTHLREVRRKLQAFVPWLSQFQSTHLREVRPKLYRSTGSAWEISIHAPTWGATNKVFKITPSRDISIHAPTWGATSSDLSFFWRASTFQSTHLREVRLNKQIRYINFKRFQSTHLREVRHIPQRLKTVSFDFNPRTYVRCDF